MNPRNNELLAAMPEHEYAVFLQHLELVSLFEGQVLFETGQVPPYVYFPVGAVISVICELDGKFQMETNMVGSSTLLGQSNTEVKSFYTAKVRKSGLVYRMSLGVYRRLRKQCPVYMESLGHVQLASFRYISLTAACGRHHAVEQQVLRWMLIYMDHAKTSVISISHAELAQLVGCRRVAVTMSLGKLVARGGLKLGRGQLEVLNRANLEQQACECYWRISGKARPNFVKLIAHQGCSG